LWQRRLPFETNSLASFDYPGRVLLENSLTLQDPGHMHLEASSVASKMASEVFVEDIVKIEETMK